MTAQEIRKQFIDFFISKGHTFVPSSPVVPLDDPTLLFTNAGMNQFKDVFLEKGSRPYSRAVNSQKCIRVSGKHNDLEEVGQDTYHHTFFEMLGNWSFGDYYKKEAIEWAWELLTDVWKLPKEKLYATVYTDDDEAAELWRTQTDIDPRHILRFGEKDNFWEMGATGPCGPCSEIHFDRGAEFCDGHPDGEECFVNSGCARYIELWNLVFIQYNRDENGDLHPLPRKHVDTGAGFERLVAILQNKPSNYDTDVFTGILDQIGLLCGTPYLQSREQMAYRVVADHVRMLSFSIADGGLPSNEGRGYVMRRILRRAARYGRKLDMREPFIYKLVPTLDKLMGEAFPELIERADHIAAIIRSEEEHFNRTLDRGLEIFDKIKSDLKQRNDILIPGSEVFRLYDTYGFPVDLTQILANENGLALDMKDFDRLMEEQKQRARAASKFAMAGTDQNEWIIMNEGPDSRFVGYDELAIETHIMRYQVGENHIRVILKDTPFYAESGGQVGDQGTISGENFKLNVVDTQKDGDHIIHLCEPHDTFMPQSDKVLAQVVTFERQDTARNHTATHLLHAALRQVLGNHVNQAGSLVEADRLRFDFSHFEKITPRQIAEMETIINQKIQQDLKLETGHEKLSEARSKGAMALFGEKYADIVRTVAIPNYSLELCGGTHVRSTGEIGLFLIVSESSIASGVRRIEAISGSKAVAYLQRARDTLQQLNSVLNTQDEHVLEKVRLLIEENKKLEKQLVRETTTKLASHIDSVLAKAETINGINTIVYQAGAIPVEQLKELGDKIRESSKATIALLTSEQEDKLNFVCIVSDDLVSSKKANASDLVKEVARVAGGGGGGRPHLATAGAKGTAKLVEAQKAFKDIVARL